MGTHSTFASLGRKLLKIGDVVDRSSERIIQGTALVVDQVVVLATPVLSGRARSGWDVAIGIEPTSVPSDEPSSAQAGTDAALSAGRSTIESWKSGQGAIYISNGLPYIIPLEEGHSAQAPAGMVAQATAAGREFARAQKLLKGVR